MAAATVLTTPPEQEDVREASRAMCLMHLGGILPLYPRALLIYGLQVNIEGHLLEHQPWRPHQWPAVSEQSFKDAAWQLVVPCVHRIN